MEARRMKGWLNYVLIIVLFFSGMCFDTVRADPYLYASNQNEAVSFQTAKSNLELPDFCTSEQLGATTLRGVVRMIGRNVAKSRTQLHSGSGTFFSSLKILSEEFCFVSAHSIERFGTDIIQYQTVIMEFIHHQDGAKG